MKVIWTDKALVSLRRIENYYIKEFSKSRASKIVSNIIASTSKLSLFPKIGKPEYIDSK